MKKYLLALGVLAVLALLCVGLIACADDLGSAEGSGEDSTTEQSQTLSLNLSEYSIVRPKGGSNAVTSAAKELQSALKELSITLPLSISDGTDRSDSFEILIGKTGLAQSTKAEQDLTDETQYMIRFTEKKIIIVARHDEALAEAVRYFMENYVAKAEGGVLSVARDTTYVGIDSTIISLMDKARFAYRIMLPVNYSDALYAQAERIQERLNEIVGMDIAIVSDSTQYTDKLILLGAPNREAATSVLGTLRVNEYSIQAVNGNVVLAAHTDYTAELAVDELLNTLLKNPTVKDNSDGTMSVLFFVKKAYSGTYCVELSELPRFTGGTYRKTYDCADSVTQDYFVEANPNTMDSYAQQLAQLGYLETERNTIGANRYITCVGEKGMVHLTYLDYNKTLTVIHDPMPSRVYKGEEAPYTKVTEAAFAVMSRDYSVQASANDPTGELDGNGQSYIITLEDGRFVIIDGGYANCGDDDAIYNYMKANNKRSGGITIAAWIFTHAHGDHYGAFTTFATQYGAQVTIDYFVYNTSTKSQFTSTSTNHSDWLEKQFKTQWRDRYFPKAEIITPHTGQVLTFANTEFEILYTIANYAPNTITWENDSTMVFRVNLSGKTFLIMGDCETYSTDVICDMYTSADLHSDVLQINHHGYSGATQELYDRVLPTYTLWTTSQAALNYRVSGNGGYSISNASIAANKYIYDKMGGAAYCFAADGDIEVFTVVNGQFSISTQKVDFKKK